MVQLSTRGFAGLFRASFDPPDYKIAGTSRFRIENIVYGVGYLALSSRLMTTGYKQTLQLWNKQNTLK